MKMARPNDMNENADPDDSSEDPLSELCSTGRNLWCEFALDSANPKKGDKWHDHLNGCRQCMKFINGR